MTNGAVALLAVWAGAATVTFIIGSIIGVSTDL